MVPVRMTHPLRSADITPLHHYYEVVRHLVASVLSPSWFNPLAAFPLATTPSFPRSLWSPLPGSAHLYAGCRSARKQTPSDLAPRSSNYRGLDIALALFDTKNGGSLSVLFLEVI